MFPGFFRTVLSLPDLLGLSSVVPLGPASLGGGPKVPQLHGDLCIPNGNLDPHVPDGGNTRSDSLPLLG